MYLNYLKIDFDDMDQDRLTLTWDVFKSVC